MAGKRDANGKTPQMRWEDRNTEWRQAYYKKNAARIFANHKAWTAANVGRLREQAKSRTAAIKAEFFCEYGQWCHCCRESCAEFLTMDHSPGFTASKTSGGRRRVGKAEYFRLKRLGWPKNLGVRVLCMNCNWAERKGAECPHSRANRNAG